LKGSTDRIISLLSWSGGKDSSLALHELKENKRYENHEVKSLITTLTKDYDRVSMHGVRRTLLLAQSEAIGIPLEEVWIQSKASNEMYQEEMAKSLTKIKNRYNISKVIFGDLFLEDIRAYREKFLQRLGMDCEFPLWRKDTYKLASLFVDSGFRAIICTVDPKKLDPKFCGREFDRQFLSEVPQGVDPCGENGEFHTFVYAGPIFSHTLRVKKGQVVQRDGFYFADILPAS
jgi:uncharacterized protein (TIGR00290 family)